MRQPCAQAPLLPLLLAAALLAPSSTLRAAPAGATTKSSPSPFESLEASLRKRASLEREKLKEAGMLKEGLEKESALALLRQHLHDIRSHRAFWELWEAWRWSKPELEVLYVGSGAHLAPLVFLHGTNAPKKVTYTYTELNPFCAMRLEAFLMTMVRAGLYSDLVVEAGPVPGSRFAERWSKEREGRGLTSASAIKFTRWVMLASEEMGIPASFVARFRFRRGETRAEIRLFVRVPDARPESTSYFNLSDLESADLAITHDWDHDPRGNLKVLLDFVEAHWAGSRAKPLAVMMEDLRKHPFPVELGFFNPVAGSSSGYGHQEYKRWSDGTKAEEEDGASLYGGGVILEPDMAYLGALSRDDRTDLFNLALFGGSALGRRNVDVIGGKLAIAPALLDLGSGYAAYDVRGADLQDKPDFLAGLARAEARLPAATPPLPSVLRPLWCSNAERFQGTLRSGKGVGLEALLSEAEADLKSNPFVRSGGSRTKLKKFMGEKARMEELLGRRRQTYEQALGALETSRDALRKFCAPAEVPPSPGGQPTPAPAP